MFYCVYDFMFKTQVYKDEILIVYEIIKIGII